MKRYNKKSTRASKRNLKKTNTTSHAVTEPAKPEAPEEHATQETPGDTSEHTPEETTPGLLKGLLCRWRWCLKGCRKTERGLVKACLGC